MDLIPFLEINLLDVKESDLQETEKNSKRKILIQRKFWIVPLN